MAPRELASNREALPKQGLGRRAPKDSLGKEALGRMIGTCPWPCTWPAPGPAMTLPLARPDTCTWPWPGLHLALASGMGNFRGDPKLHSGDQRLLDSHRNTKPP